MSEIRICGARSNDDRHKVQDLIYHTFYQNKLQGRREMEQFLNHLPDFLLHHNRMLWADDKLAACITLYTYTLRLGEARLKMGGIAHVATASSFQKQGYAARLMEDTLQYMKAEGYEVSVLFGIADFYHRWGYTFVFPEHSTQIEVEEALICSHGGGREREMKPADLNAIQRIHLRNDSDTAASIIRFSQHYSMRWDHWKNARVLLDEHGKVVAYHLGTFQGTEYQVTEAGVADGTWTGPLLHACALHARESFASQLNFYLPPLHPLARSFVLLESDHTTRISRNCHGMMTILDVGDTFKAMKPEWEHRLKRYAPRDFSSEVTLLTEKEAWRIRCEEGRIEIAPQGGKNKLSLTRQELTQLLVGYRHLEELLCSGRRPLPHSSRLLLETLFPKRFPYIWTLDRF
ncbi:MAG: GNAT family N-acetyltransferase [Candidatus Hydrogenedens sp.]|jgi:predicted acetyltransferase|nr:GNAT family N-acetyltransferase [Candidatus Hydrogenedens sp.]